MKNWLKRILAVSLSVLTLALSAPSGMMAQAGAPGGELVVRKILTQTASVNVPDSAVFTFTVVGTGVNFNFSRTKAQIEAGDNSQSYPGLAAGRYTVTETAKYTDAALVTTTTATVQVDAGPVNPAALTGDGLSAEVSNNKTTTVVFTNAYDTKLADYTVKVKYYQNSVVPGGYLGESTYSTTAHVGDGIALAAGTAANQLDYLKPATGYNSGVQQGLASYTVIDGENVINVLYVQKDLTVAVKYYKDSVGAGNLLGESTYSTTAHAGDGIVLGAGTAANQLDYLKPVGYNSGVQQGTIYEVIDGTNVINVVYVQKDLTVTVKYYKDSVGGTLLGESTYSTTAHAGDNITLSPGAAANHLDYLKPASGYNSGVQQGAVYEVIDGINVINVVYAQKNLTVTVKYYKDSVGGTLLGESTYSTAAHAGDGIVLAAGTAANQLDYLKPASGYNSGVQQGAIYEVIDGTNVINVVYVQKDLTVTVKYYKDSVGGTLLGESTYSTTAHAGDNITLSPGAAANHLDYKKPATGYNSGVQQGAVYEVIDGTNVINVVYAQKNLTVTVKYYQNIVSPASYLGESTYSTTAHEGDTVTLAAGTAAGQLDYKKPATGYNSGVQQGLASYTVIDGENIINVLYVQKDLTVTVKYYKDSIGAGNLLGESTYSTTAHAGDGIVLGAGTAANQLDYLKPATGYNSGAQRDAVPYYVIDGTNVINVVYIQKDLTVTVKYYKDSVGAGNLLGESTYSTTAHEGDAITLGAGTAAGQLDYKKPATGYNSGVQQGLASYAVIDGENIINVVYLQKDLTVTVKYYKDSVGGSLLGESTYSTTAHEGDDITLGAGTAANQLDYLKPATGYNSGVQQGLASHTVIDGENVINVVYVQKDLTVTVKYYKDSVGGSLLGESTYSTTAHEGDDITLGAGTAANQLDYLKPATGYNSGVQQGKVPYGVIDGENVINVVYVKKDLCVKVLYYKNSISLSNLLGLSVYSATAHEGDVITLEEGSGCNQLDFRKPATGYSSGVQQGTVPYTVIDGINFISVVYTQKDLEVTVRYYKNSVEPGNLLGTGCYAADAHEGDAVTLTGGTAEGQLDYKKPATGYNSGTQQGAVPYSVVDGANVIDVVYVQKDITVTVNYYKGGISADNLLGSCVYTETAHEGDKITLADGTQEGQLNFKKPGEGYGSGLQQGSVPYVAEDRENNVINVLYGVLIEDEDPPTGDAGNMGIPLALLSLAALTGSVILVKRHKAKSK